MPPTRRMTTGAAVDLRPFANTADLSLGPTDLTT
jgi:hypothetical protein